MDPREEMTPSALAGPGDLWLAIAAIVLFAHQVLSAPAESGDADFERLRALGYREEQIAEVAGLVALQLMTGLFWDLGEQAAQLPRRAPRY